MSPPKPPQRPPSKLLPAIREEVAAGAVHVLRPIPDTNAPTWPPPPPDRRSPPVEFRAPRAAPTAIVVPRLAVPPPLPKHEDADEHTIVGLGPQSAAPERDSQTIATETLLLELAAKGEQARKAQAEADELRKALALTKQPPARERSTDTKSEPPPSPAQWGKAAFKVLVAVGALLTALTTWLGVRNATTLEPRLDTAEEKQRVQKSVTLTVEQRVKALEKYVNALERHSGCVDAERDSAIERGTGHVVEGDHDVDWVQQSKPIVRMRVLWEAYPWSPAVPCPSKPHPPPAPP